MGERGCPLSARALRCERKGRKTKRTTETRRTRRPGHGESSGTSVVRRGEVSYGPPGAVQQLVRWQVMVNVSLASTWKGRLGQVSPS